MLGRGGRGCSGRAGAGKLARGVGGTLLLNLSYIFCLAACGAAFGRSAPIAKIGVVYLTGSAISRARPLLAASARWNGADRRAHGRGRAGAAAASAAPLFRLGTSGFPSRRAGRP